MAAQAKGKSRVKNLKVFFEKVDEDLKQNKTDELCKTIRKDKNVWKTFSDLHDILKKGFSETELRQSEMGKSLVSNIRRSEIFDILPKDIKQDISALSTEENNPVDKKQGEGKTPPTSAKQSRTDNQGVDSGPAPAPIKSSHSPAVGRKAKDEKDPEIANLKEQIPTKSNHSPSAARKANNEKEGEITKLQKEIEKLKTELETEKKTAKEKSHILDDRGKQIKDLEKAIREKDEQMKVSSDEAEHLSKRVKEENMKRTNVEKHLKEKEELAMRLERQANDNYCENQLLQARVKELESACKTLAKEKNQVEHNAKKCIEHMEGNFKDEKRKFDDEYKKLLAERDDLRDRFSKLAGKKLQEQNADIADLSDPNRAMKLSERFGQLYDDEWTNAFESLTDKKLGVPLKDAINVLLRLLQECWTFCNNLMETQMGSLQNVFLHPVQNMANFDQKKTGFTDRPRIASKDQLSLQDLRKRVGVSPPVIEEVKQALLADSKTWDKREKKEFDKKHIEACTPYIIKCAEVCWLMALHDPPLVMKMDVKPGEKFDTNIYTVYSQSGQTIDYLVWPPLYNGKDGGLLSKGVAEPVKVVTKKK